MVALSSTAAQAELARGLHQFGSERHCVSAGRLPSQLCANAAANAAAEFEEKAPRFPSRAACERVYRGGCAIGFRGAQGFAGRREAIFFTPRQTGFRVTVKSESDARVVPLGPDFGFGARSALLRDTTIHPTGSRDYRPPSGRGAGDAATTFGIATPEGARGPLPPRPPVDPNFDCSSVLEPGSDPSTGCALAPARRR